MVGFVDNTLTPIPEDVIIGKSYLNSEYICHCQYCNKELKNIQTLRIHYRTCAKRLLMRYYISNEFLFGLYCNPGKYLKTIEEEIKQSGDAKLIMGAIRAFMFTKNIRGLMVMEIKENKNSGLYKNGRILYNDIKLKMTPEQIQQLEKERATLIQAQKGVSIIDEPNIKQTVAEQQSV